MEAGQVIATLKSMGNRRNAEGMARFGIKPQGALGVPMPALRAMAKPLGKDHALASALWDSGIHEARILAALVEDQAKVDEEQAESWAKDLDSWDVCDQLCLNLLWKAPFAWRKAGEWSTREEEFVKRAGFALMAVLAVHDKKAKDEDFVRLFPLIEEGAKDERNFVKKSVNWALRQIGKRNPALNRKAIGLARMMAATESKSGRWVGSDALRELEGDAVRKRLKMA